MMLAASVVAWVVRPRIYLADQRPQIDLESMVPKRFGSWHELEQSNKQIVNPQQDAQLKKLYTETLSRTYVNSTGNLIMLSIAYGRDQRDAVSMHYPEVCYPSQGFQAISNVSGLIANSFGKIPVKRLEMVLGQRYESVTYWAMIGNHSSMGRIEKKNIEMGYAIKGVIPDGLLFRVSSIDYDSSSAFIIQEKFVTDLLKSLPAGSRNTISGL